MLLTETTGKEQQKEEKPEEFFAKYILSRAFEGEQDGAGPEVLQVGLIDPNTAYELALCESTDTGEELFMVRVASYPSKGIQDWIKTGIFSTMRQAQAYIYYLRSRSGRLQRI